MAAELVRNLKRLLATHFRLSFSQTYATDVLVFIKPGKMSGNVPMRDLRYCASTYTVPEIEIVQPLIALCLGAKTFNAIRCARNLPQMKLRAACVPSAHTLISGTEVYGVPHTGSWGTNNAGGLEAVETIWASLAQRYHLLMQRNRFCKT